LRESQYKLIYPVTKDLDVLAKDNREELVSKGYKEYPLIYKLKIVDNMQVANIVPFTVFSKRILSDYNLDLDVFNSSTTVSGIPTEILSEYSISTNISIKFNSDECNYIKYYTKIDSSCSFETEVRVLNNQALASTFLTPLSINERRSTRAMRLLLNIDYVEIDEAASLIANAIKESINNIKDAYDNIDNKEFKNAITNLILDPETNILIAKVISYEILMGKWSYKPGIVARKLLTQSIK